MIKNIEEMFEQLAYPLHKFINNIVKNTHDTEDLLSDTFVRIIEYIDAHERFPEKALCFAIARNLSLDFLRKKKRIYLPDSETYIMSLADDVDVETQVETHEFQNHLDDLINRLPEIYANVFSLKFYDDMTFSEIGKVMNVNESHARVLYFRAKNKMKKILDKGELYHG